MNLKERERQLKTDIPAVFLCLKSKDTPLIAKIPDVCPFTEGFDLTTQECSTLGRY